MNPPNISLAYGDNFYLMIVALGVFIALFIYYLWRMDRKGQSSRFTLRDIKAYDAAREGLSRAAETGRAVHTSPGTGTIGSGSTTASTLAGLTLVETMARVSAITGAPVQATTNDAVAYNLAENALRSGYGRAGWSMESEGGVGARFITQDDPLAYVAGASEVVAQENVSHAVMAGRFGSEALFLMEAQRRAGAQQIAGSSEHSGVALMFIAADHTLIGEEIFASGAYLESRPSHIASLLAQDGLRWAVIILIVAGFIAANIIGLSPLSWFTMYP